MENKKDFKEEFYRIINLIENKNSFVFVRYGDGEVMLMNGESVGEHSQAFMVDKWKSEGKTKLGNELVKSLNNKDWYYGIPCECCNLRCKNYLLSLLDIPEEQITYANLWVNSNYDLFLEWLKCIKEEVILICNENASNKYKSFPFPVKYFYPIKNDCVNFYEENSDKIISDLNAISNNYSNTLFLISAGPLSEVIINHLYSNNKNNKYIDVGSSIDEYIHGKKTRPYMIKNNMYNLKDCKF